MLTYGPEKNEGIEQPIPEAWRPALKRIADAFAMGHLPKGEGIRPVDPEVAAMNFGSIEVYPDQTGPLQSRSWDTSICIWMGDHWDVLVDLTTSEGEASDLVLHAKAFEVEGRVEIQPGMIYVP